MNLPLPVLQGKTPSVLSVEEARAMQRMNISRLQYAVDIFHKRTNERVTKRRIEEIKHKEKTSLVAISFEKSNFVLVRRAHKKGYKLPFNYVGPRKIISVKSNWGYDVNDLVSGKQETIHASRLTPYRADGKGTDILRCCFPTHNIV